MTETIPDPSGTRKTIPDPLWISAATPEEVAAVLRRAADARHTVAIRGAGTKSRWGRPGEPVDEILDMRKLNRVLAHEHGDMTATVEAGATLRDVNLALAQHRQWLPLDPSSADRATIGGILATNDSGPLRHRFGTPRDLVIGIRLATTDGVLAKSGGQVVKNVAGYDLGKLIAGSFGSLAAIVSATFKLSPMPPASKTLRVDIGGGSIAAVVAAVMTSQLEPLAFEICVRDGRAALLVRFASLPAVVDAQIDQARALLTTGTARTALLSGDEETSAWREHVAQVWTDDDSTVVRASWLPADVDAAIAEVQASTARLDVRVIGRAAIGAGVMRISGPVDAQAHAIERLRASAAVGNVTIVRAPAALTIDAWPRDGSPARLFASLKDAFDPAHVLVGHGPL